MTDPEPVDHRPTHASVTGWTAEFWRDDVMIGSTDRVERVDIDGTEMTLTFEGMYLGAGPVRARTVWTKGVSEWVEMEIDDRAAHLVQRIAMGTEPYPGRDDRADWQIVPKETFEDADGIRAMAKVLRPKP